jgi:hypothetical protein
MNLSDDTTNNAKTVPRWSASDEHSNPKLECDTTLWKPAGFKAR